MLIELNRFLTTEEVRREYRVPAAVADEILPKLPVFETQEDGTRIHLEKDVDEFLAEFSRQRRKIEAQTNPPNVKSGRNIETLEIALFVDELKRKGMTWKDIFRACRERWPSDDRVQNSEQIRATHRRHFKTTRKRSD